MTWTFSHSAQRAERASPRKPKVETDERSGWDESGGGAVAVTLFEANGTEGISRGASPELLVRWEGTVETVEGESFEV